VHPAEVTVLVAPVLGVLAHVVHYTLVLGGAAVVVVLLVSARPGRARQATTSHDRRIADLRVAAAAGALAAPPTVVATLGPNDPAPLRDPSQAPTAVVVAMVSSAAAAGVHAAAGPVHFRVGLLVGAFFVLSALAQLAWTMALLLRGPDRTLLWLGLVGNAAVIALWVVTRTVGLPFSTALGLEGVEPVGSWDVAASAWEAVVVGCCAVVLSGSWNRSGEFARGSRAVVDMVRWSPASRAWLVGSVVVMVALTLTGAPA
jgi:hypothetical protein